MSNHTNKKAILKCPLHYKKEFKESTCSLAISVGQPIHEGEKFRATLKVVNDSFKKCAIIIGDSLQRHTLKTITTDKNLHKKANDLGQEWLERNLEAINQLDIEYNITHWDYWLKHPQYPIYRKQIDELFITDQEFKDTIEDTAAVFLARNLNKINKEITHQASLNYSYEYLKEECAVILIWAECKYDFDIYPGGRNLAMNYIYKTIISKTNPNLVREVSVKYKNSSLIK